MAEPFLGQISVFGFEFAPVNWQQCKGQIININQSTALFALLGTRFGGNGTTNFGLPNMQGNVAVGQGQLTGGSNYVLGGIGGASSIALSRPQGPSHGHDLMATVTAADKKGPAGNVLAKPEVPVQTKATVGKLYNPNPLDTKLNATISPIGNGEPHDNLQPFLVLNYCICTIGIVPPRG
ncbi:MAG TPA: tail fiber protein [Reyranella sp.]|jgi:microcystin-dependent protein|nr:tail fiber protein [Reyranella sp.]